MRKLFAIIWLLLTTAYAATIIFIALQADSPRGIYPKNHGAVCDGKHDDTQAFIDSMIEAGDTGWPIMIPEGTCMLTRPDLEKLFYPKKEAK